MKEAVIVSTARTPIGKAYRGGLNDTPGATLGGHAIEHALKRSGLDGGEIEDVIMGCAMQEGATGLNVARRALVTAGLPVTVAGTTSQDYLDTLDLPALAVPDVDAAVQELLEGRADAVVFDEPVLRYQARTTANGQAHMVPKTYQPQSIAMAWRDGDPHIEQVDLALLGMREEGVLETLDQQWFGTE